MKRAYAALAALACLLFASGSFADQPVDWQMRLQQAATPVMEEITWFEQYTLWFIIPITIVVAVLLAVVALKFRAAANPVASSTSHNTMIELVWTIAPVIILLAIALPSFQMLTNQLTIPKDPDITVKVTASQWQWNYEYPGDAGIAYDSYHLKDDERAAAGKEDRAIYPRLLAVDNEMVLPVGKTVRFLVTAAPTDVIHSFAMPSFGIKVDAVPGRLNETWARVDREGLYYGQCSELCGKDHAFMPIAIRVVSEEKYKTWLAAAATNVDAANKALMAQVDGAAPTVQVAENVSK